MLVPPIVGKIAVRLSNVPAVRSTVARTRHTRALRSFSSLNAYENKVFLQNGEDGLLHEILFRIGRDRYFVEFGVQDGSECNTALLSAWYGWRGVLIEGDPAYAGGLQERYRDRDVNVL